MINKKYFDKLKSYTNAPCVSIYVPTLVTGDYEKNRIRWKNACNKALNKLNAEYPGNSSLLDDAFALIDNTDFWAHQSQCLVGFYGKGVSSYFNLVSAEFDHVSVSDTFYLAPLVREITNEERVFVLALSKNETKFYEAVEEGIYPVFIHDKVVVDMDEALNFDDPNSSLQHRSVGFGSAIFHGNGPGNDKDDVRTMQYLRRVDDGIMEIIHDETVPMVLACVEEYYPVYKSVTRYNHLSDHMITGNPEQMDAAAIRRSVDPVFQEIRKNKIDSFVNEYGLKSQKALTNNNIDDILEQSKHKNIDKLLISKQYLNQLSDVDKEKFDTIAMNTYENGGSFIIAELGDRTDVTIQSINRFEMDMA